MERLLQDIQNDNIGFDALMSKLNDIINIGIWQCNGGQENNLNLIRLVANRINSTRLRKDESKGEDDIEVDMFTEEHREVFRTFCFQLRNTTPESNNSYNVENFIDYVESADSLENLIYILINANDNGHTWNFHNNRIHTREANTNLINLVRERINNLRFQTIERNGVINQLDIFTNNHRDVFRTFCLQLKHIGARL